MNLKISLEIPRFPYRIKPWTLLWSVAVLVGATLWLGWSVCRTPGCSHQADILTIGRFVKLVCQQCGGTWGFLPAKEKAA